MKPIAILVALCLTGCLIQNPPSTQPAAPTAAQVLSGIEWTESAAYVALSVAHSNGKLSESDWANVVKYNDAFLAVDSDIAKKLASGQALTPSDVSTAMAAVLADVVNVHAKAAPKIARP